MPRTSETDSERTTPGDNTAKKRKDSYTKEADNLRNCPLNLRTNENCLLCGKAKKSPEANPHSQAPKGEEAAKGKETFHDSGAAIKPTVEKNSCKEKKEPAHLVKSMAKAKAKAETKKMVSAQIQTSPVSAPAKETQTTRRESRKHKLLPQRPRTK